MPESPAMLSHNDPAASPRQAVGTVRLVTLLAFLCCIYNWPGFSQAPTFETVLARARQVVADFAGTLGVLVADEECEQKAYESLREAKGSTSFGNPVQIGGLNPVRVDPRGKRRRRAAIAIAPTPGSAMVGRPWLEVRNVLQVDGRPVPNQEDRLSRLFRRPDWTVKEAEEISQESARLNIGPSGRLTASPWLPLLVLHPTNERRFSFEKTGEESVQKTKAWKIDYRERTAPTLFMAGNNPCGAAGTLWIDPLSGRVLRALLQCVDLQRSDFLSVMTATYRQDEHLGLEVPVEMSERPESDSGKQWLGSPGKLWVEGKCSYSGVRKLDAGSAAPEK